MTFNELAAQRDPLYAATKTREPFTLACQADASIDRAARGGHMFQATAFETVRDTALLRIAIRALRNQGEPYYHREAQP